MIDKFCPHCGRSNRITARFCVQCRHAFHRLRAQGKFCAQCGARRKPGAKFCAQCGLRWPAPLPFPTVAPEPPIQQPTPKGIVLPLLDEDESLHETQIDPMSRALQPTHDSLVRKGGQTGIILTEAELERLRQQPDRPLFIYTPKPTKRR